MVGASDLTRRRAVAARCAAEDAVIAAQFGVPEIVALVAAHALRGRDALCLLVPLSRPSLLAR